MTGIRRSYCPECKCTIYCECGIDSPGGFCTAVDDNPCPSTLAVTFTIPEYDITCSDAWHNVYFTAPATTVTVPVGFNHPTLRICGYYGSINETISVVGTNCTTGSTLTFTNRLIIVDIREDVEYGTIPPLTVLISSPCGTTPLDPSAPQCAGMCLRVSETFRATYSWDGIYHGQGYKLNDIDDCTEEVPCWTAYSGEADLSAHEPAGISTITGLSIT